MSSPDNLLVTFGMLSNLVLTVSIVLLNKSLFKRTGLPSITLTFLHFVVTSIGLEVCRRLGLFVTKRISFYHVFLLSLSFCVSVVSSNLSLQYNVIGTYQIFRVLTMPCLMLIYLFGYNKTSGVASIISLFPLTLGVYLNSYYDINFNIVGSFWALLSVVATSMYLVLVGEKQKQLNLTSMQLLYYQLPFCALSLFFVIFFIEQPASAISRHSWTFTDICLIAITCFTAFLINLNVFWIVGKTSALSYNVLSHLKLVSTLIAGYIVFRDPLTDLQLLGICSTLVGVVTYSHFKLQQHYLTSSTSVRTSHLNLVALLIQIKDQEREKTQIQKV